MAEVTGVKVNELPKKTAYDESDLIYVVGNGIDLKMEMKDLKRNVAPDVFSGATELTPGEKGLVPTPTVTDSNKVLGGDGEWKELAPVATSGDFDDLDNKPEITEVEANPTDTPTAELEKITIGTTTYSILSSKVYGEASGDLITVDDAMEAPLEECKVTLEPQQDLHGYDHPWPAGGGKNKLQVAATSQTINGVTFTVNDDGTINVKGTATQNITLELSRKNKNGTPLPEGDLIMNGCPSGGSTSSYYLTCWRTNSGNANDVGEGRQFAYQSDWDFVVSLVITSGTVCNNLTFKPMIRLASVQDATFEPYSNICPISGHTEANVSVSGVNIWDEEWESGSISDASGQDATNSNYRRSKNYISVKANKKYYFNVPSKYGTTYRFYQYKQDKDYIGIKTVDSDGTFETDNDCAFIRFRIATTEDYTNDISINYPSTDTEYHAYQGATYTIQLGDTYYGGKLDVVSGVLMVDRAMVDLGALNWTYSNGFFRTLDLTSAIKRPANNYTIVNAISSMYNAESWNAISGTSNGKFAVSASTNDPLIVCNTDYTDATAFKTAMSGVQLVYELATPQEIQLTPTEVTLLLGINNLWSDGEMYVKYRRDLDIFLNKLEARVRALEEG